jgi:hypothetical protein
MFNLYEEINMQLYAIGIYEREPPHSRISIAQKDKSLFASNDLEKFEKSTLPRLPADMAVNGVYSLAVDNEMHYVQARENMLLVISSRSKLLEIECNHLFKNIYHIHKRPEAVKRTLDHVLANPIGFIGRDLLVERVSESLGDLKIVMLDNIEKVLARGERINELEAKTIKLEADAQKFHKSAKNLNRCCRF